MDSVRHMQMTFNRRRPPPHGSIARGAATGSHKVELWSELGIGWANSGMHSGRREKQTAVLQGGLGRPSSLQGVYLDPLRT